MDSVDPQDIELGPIIGNGAFSTVFSATYKGERVALKRQAYGEHILRELSVLKQIDHPSLLRYIGSCEYNHQDSKEVWILSEFVGGGDVSKYLKGKKSPRLTWKETVQIALDAAEGLRYMHERHIIHRDIKAANMLLDDNLRIRLCDFGFAREVASDNENNAIQDDGPSPQSFQTHGRRMSLCGTDTYMPPVVEWLEDLQKDLNETRIYRRSSSSFGVPEGDDEASLSDSFASSAGLHPYDMDSGDDDCEPSAHLHENDEAHFDETSAPSYAGPLLMPHGHMHRWRQRWVVIQNSIVWIFKNQKQYQLHRQLTDEESYSDGKRSAKLPISTPLAGCKMTNRRWTLSHPARNIKWKFQASTSHDMQLWVAIVSRAITVADYLAAGDGSSMPTDPVDTSDEIYSWLDTLGLACYFHTFKTKGFATLDFIREVRLA
ncbi:hypothetical protein DYB32_000396 [Aphanomyces invadans]|uniref:Uncharacterized protein n=1 Tax=Aphanomyces invadans TaxID=157072 RepID=A0A418BA99_9STRA|nr:hypothetical protein DYB32_000396 [Aphanomyces invadans]